MNQQQHGCEESSRHMVPWGLGACQWLTLYVWRDSMLVNRSGDDVVQHTNQPGRVLESIKVRTEPFEQHFAPLQEGFDSHESPG